MRAHGIHSRTRSWTSKAIFMRIQNICKVWRPRPSPKCHGYIDLMQIPQPYDRPHPYSSATAMTSALYTEFLQQDEAEYPMQSAKWKHYLCDKLVLEDKPYHYFAEDRDDFASSSLAQSGANGLTLLHQHGILHGDVTIIHHESLVTLQSNKIMWLNFDSVILRKDISRKTFDLKAAREITCWKARFK